MGSTLRSVEGVRIAGIASAIPAQRADLQDLETSFSDFDIAKSARTVGVDTRHIAPESVTSSDLCEAAARTLLSACDSNAEDIDLLIFISQTPDYVLPATSCSLHGRLSMAPSCVAFDVNLGCSGYTYGLWMASNLMKSSGQKRALLLAGDTVSKICNPRDKSVVPVFGDAGTATLLETDDTAPPMAFSLGTDGCGAQNLIVPAGGFRTPRSPETGATVSTEDGNQRSQDDLYMNGGEIFTFTLKEIPPLMDKITTQSGWTGDQIDYYIFHQANEFMLEHLRKRLKVPAEKFVKALRQFGNTSSASIPLAMTHCLNEELRQGSKKLILAGFGVGYSWGAVAVDCGPMVMPDLIEVQG